MPIFYCEVSVKYDTQSTNLRNSVSLGSGGGAGTTLSYVLTNLTPGVTYYFKAYAKNGDGEAGGDVFSFRTASNTIPGVTTNNATSVSANGATLNGTIDANGGADITDKGFYWGTSSGNLNNKVSRGSGGSVGTTFNTTLSNLNSGTTYYFKAYAVNSVGEKLGDLKQFTTTSNSIPTLTTDNASSVTSTGATLNATINGNGGAAITSRGFQWGTSSSNLNNNLSCGSGGGAGNTFLGSLTGLNPGTTYYYRAYATNSVGTGYGTTKSFTTLSGNTVPTVTTDNVTGGSTLNATINNTGGASITARGFQWGTSSSNLNNTLSCGSGGSNGSTFSGTPSGLSPGTTYYYRAYATNSVGTGYGTTKSFTTSNVAPTVTTDNASSITATGATLNATINGNGGATITSRGFQWGTSSSNLNNSLSCGSGGGAGNTFLGSLTGLSPGTTYYYRAYATNSVGTGYGTTKSFTTLVAIPTVTTGDVTGGSTLNATINSTGGASITARGFQWGTSSSNLSNNLACGSGGSNGSTFSGSLIGLSPGTTYYYRAYATNSTGTGYGTTKSFTAATVAPTVTTDDANSITASGATLNATINANGGAAITSRGFQWGTSSGSLSNNLSCGSGGGAGNTFSGSLTGLNPGTTYYYRAYATNSVGTSYGATKSFTTSIAVPTVTTGDVTGGSTLNATINNIGGASITARGFQWGTSSSNLSNNLSCGSGGSNGSTFSGLLAGLSPGTTYYYRAYATNSAGTGYGITKSFTTSNVAPTVTTDDASSITSIGATLNATINANGGAAITARGFQWGTSSGSLSNNLSCGSGGGSGSTFSGSLTGLNPSTTYYYRAYATNSVGTSYGITKSFTTVAGNATPTVTTDNTSNVTNTGATLHATINGTGGATITARGFHWGTSSGSLSNTLSCGSGGSANSTYSGSLTGLSPGTTYYYRAYATNSVGTGYGTTKSFTTAPSTPPRIEIIQVPNTVPIKIGTPNNNNQTVDEFLINGSRILNTDSTLPGSLTVKGHPIAVHSQMNPKEIQYYYNVSNAASVKCKYDISTVSGAHSWTNDYAPNTAISGTIKVPFPLFNAVGKYYLAVHFEYYNSGGSFLTSQTIEHPLYLLYGSLDNNEIVPNYNYTPYPNNYVMADTKIPRTAWLDMAMEFLRLGPKRLALEGIDDWIVRSLMNGIYRNDGVTHPIWQYGLHQDQTGPAAPVYRYPAPWLIENRKPSLSAYTGLALRTDCEQIRDVLRILGNSLGVSVGSQRFSPDYAGLMTKPGYPAFDNAGMNGYRRINGEIEDNPSVWFFLDHFYTEYGQNAYDPVFNIKDVALNMYQEHILALKEPSKWYRLEDGTILYSLLPKEILDSSNNYVFNNRGWVKISYDYPFSPANMLPLSLTPLETAKLETAARNAAKNNPSANDQLRKATLRVPPGASVNCVGYDLTDTDNNGLAEWLSLDIEVYSGLYDLEGFLEAEIYGSNGSLITSSRMSTQNLSFDDNLISLSSFTSEYLTLYFNGKHIKDSEIDGPYEIHVHLTNEGENIFLEDWLSTDPLLADDFQGNLLEVTAISDSLINLGETLRFTASIQAQVAGDYDLSASLFKINGAEQTGLGNLALNLNLAAGINQVNFDFDAKELRGKGISGPYDLFLSSSDEFYANYDHHQSAGYLLSQLASPSAYIDGELSEIIIQPSSKIMTAANELFISAPVVVSNAGIYHMQAILWDQEGNLLSATLWQDTLSAGPQPVEFNFDLSGLPVVESPCVVEFRICDDYAQYGFSAILEVEI